MAFIVPVSDKFAVGDTVKAYPESNWAAHLRPPAPGSTQLGSATESQTVAAAGTVTYSALAEDTTYYLTKDGSGVYVRVRPDAQSNRQDPGGGGATAPIVTYAPGNLRKVTVTAGTRVALSATSLPVKRALACAISSNTGVVVVGGSGVLAVLATRNSPFLNAGDTQDLGAVDLANVYLDSTVDAEGVTVYYES